MHSTIGLVGVGRMGGALLPHLLSVAPVVAHDADPARAEAVRTAGAQWTDDVDEVFRSATTLVTVLPGPRELQSVMASAAFLRPGALWIDMTSGDPRVSDRLAAAVEALGGQAVGAPIAGSPLDAERRSLTFFVGGPPSAKAAAAPLLEHLSTGGTVRDAGPRAGDAQTAKLVANALWFAIVVATSEALLLGRSLGIEPPALAALLRDSAGGSVFADRHLGPMLDGDPFATFGIAGSSRSSTPSRRSARTRARRCRCSVPRPRCTGRPWRGTGRSWGSCWRCGGSRTRRADGSRASLTP
jgi:3-hydroxyisobutyrate dehydrogenase